MERNGWWLRVMVVLTCLIAASGAGELRVRSKADKAVYNHTLATMEVVASSVYMSDLTELFSWICDAGTKDLNAAVRAFKGTQEQSIQNWVGDLYRKQLDINYPSMPGAMVHHGFIMLITIR